MPNVNNLIKVYHDQHVHSAYSADSSEAYINYYKKACESNVSYLITTEHIDFEVHEDNSDWLVDFKSLKEEIAILNKNNKVKCLLGVELGYRRDYLNELIEISNSEDFDTINLSIHGDKKADYYFKEFFIRDGIKETLHRYYEEMYDAVTTFDNFTVLSHIDYGFKTVYNMNVGYEFLSDKEMLEKIIKVVIKKEKALEINLKVQNFLGIEHTKELLKLYKDLGGKYLTLSSDAHILDAYRKDFDKYLELIKESGFEYVTYFVKKEKYYYYL